MRTGASPRWVGARMGVDETNLKGAIVPALLRTRVGGPSI